MRNRFIIAAWIALASAIVVALGNWWTLTAWGIPGPLTLLAVISLIVSLMVMASEYEKERE